MLTAQQICVLAATIAKLPGGVVFAGQMLNLTLDDLVLNRNLKMNRITSILTIPANSNGPFNLEDDYLRTYDMFYMQDGFPFFLNQITQDQMDAEIISPQVNNYPYEFSTDISAQGDNPPGLATMTIYPQIVTQTDFTHRYMVRRAQLVTPESSGVIPWMQDQDYLIHATATRMMKITDDDRWDAYEKKGEELLMKHLLMQGDEQKAVITVARDPRRWRNTKSLPNTKSQPL